ncbi:MAG TPA: GNAT family N-acetyltransferase [Usitatibacter sp.]|nr:GNAT family N-acetyltransferase [Usitatibacter sp.]
MRLTFHPLTPERLPDLEAIFNARGCSVARGCWCLFYRDSGKRPDPPAGQTRAQHSRMDLRRRVKEGEFIGLLGYRGKTPVGWVSLGPREVYKKLERSRVMKPVDDKPVWSIVCFVVPADYRGQGVAKEMLRGAVAYARRQGARLVEAYPIDKPARSNDDFMWFGARSMFDDAGFEEVARRTPTRPVVRLRLRKAA